jgi:membrane associated rhomboid family serine protease
MATCYRHSSVETGVSCSNCNRPICPDCMTPTSVGMRCPECAKQKTKVRTVRTMATEPRVTYALIAINVIVFLAITRGSRLYADLALLGHFGSVPGLGVEHGEYWRLVTSGFLHASVLHLFFNMFLLYMLGQELERQIGSSRFAALYGASLLAGSCGALIVKPEALTVGASGAVFGLMGAMVIEQRARGFDPFSGGLFGGIGGLIVLNLVLSFAVSGISIGGHIGGLVGGTVSAWLMQEAARRKLSTAAQLGACGLVSAVAVVVGIAAAGGSGIG